VVFFIKKYKVRFDLYVKQKETKSEIHLVNFSANPTMSVSSNNVHDTDEGLRSYHICCCVPVCCRKCYHNAIICVNNDID
jgi:hypothetical protein